MPVFMAAGMALFLLINPEIAIRSQNYERNYHLLEMARNLGFLATLFGTLCIWLLTCFLLLKSKEQSCRWLFLSMLGPVGFAILTILPDNAPSEEDTHQRFINRLNPYLRTVYELSLFVAMWVLAYQAVALKRNLMILFESVSTGVSTAQIMAIQNASSGMWAFSEGLETMYLVVLFYLLWPPFFNLVNRLVKSRTASR